MSANGGAEPEDAEAPEINDADPVVIALRDLAASGWQPKMDLGWFAISGVALLDGLHRAAVGEDPDLLYTEIYANSRDDR